jgi:hypothetical protein
MAIKETLGISGQNPSSHQIVYQLLFCSNLPAVLPTAGGQAGFVLLAL